MFMLADVNSMYCACEQVFRPDLKGRPVAVLSNNDGALVAINREEKISVSSAACRFPRPKKLLKIKILLYFQAIILYTAICRRAA